MYYPKMNQYRQDFSRVMTVTGNARLLFEPDKVSIQLEIMTENKQVSQAQQENARKMNQVIQSLLQLGILRGNIQTTGYNINPIYDYIDGKQQFKGYRVSNTITVQITSIDQAGEIIDVAVQNGVNQVSNIQFSIEDKQIAYQQALSAALKNAIAEAQIIAETLNVNFDPIPIKIVEETSETPPSFKTFATMESNVTTPIEPGQIVVSASVKTQFQY
ncbi:SIMPL domain-containing protein [Virgibacillus necropolis]|nr:SIMPL domain-containing protein [Virgibacillus necropolis]